MNELFDQEIANDTSSNMMDFENMIGSKNKDTSTIIDFESLIGSKDKNIVMNQTISDSQKQKVRKRLKMNQEQEI